MRYTYTLATLLFTLLTCSYGKSEDEEFITAASNLANTISFGDVISEYGRACDGLISDISSLKIQYDFSLMRYGRDISRLGDGIEIPGNIHNKNADELEKIRLVLNYKLEKLVLIERLKALDEEYSRVKEQLRNMPRLCLDLDEFLKRLNLSNEVKIECYSSEEPSVHKQIIFSDKPTIKKLNDLFSSKNLRYDPVISPFVYEEGDHYKPYMLPSQRNMAFSVWDVDTSVDITIDNQVYMEVVSGDEVVCLAKTYSWAGSGTDLYEQICALVSQGSPIRDSGEKEAEKKIKKGVSRKKGSPIIGSGQTQKTLP